MDCRICDYWSNDGCLHIVKCENMSQFKQTTFVINKQFLLATD